MNEIVMFPSTLRYMIFRDPVDMRKSFDGLGKLVFRHLGKHGDGEPILYLFFNKDQTCVKALFYNHQMITILYGRRKEEPFKLPGFAPDQKSVDVSPATLTALIQGLSIVGSKSA